MRATAAAGPGALALVACWGCASGNAGGPRDQSGGTPLSGPAAFQVHGQLSLTATPATAGIPAPDQQDFLLFVDPGTPRAVGFNGTTLDEQPATTTDRVSFSLPEGLSLALPSSCTGSSVSYSSFRFTVDGTAGTLAGTARGRATVVSGDLAFSYDATLSFTGTRDQTGPAFDLSAAMDPFHPTPLRSSRPLPPSATAQLMTGGTSIALDPMSTAGGPIVGFSVPAGRLLPYGMAYDVIVTPWQDLAGDPGAPPGQLMTRAPLVLVDEEGFENRSAAYGDGLVEDSSVLPPISGQRSGVLAAGNTGLAFDSAHVSARLQVAPGDTVVRFSAQPFGSQDAASTSDVLMQAGVPGGRNHQRDAASRGDVRAGHRQRDPGRPQARRRAHDRDPATRRRHVRGGHRLHGQPPEHLRIPVSRPGRLSDRRPARRVRSATGDQGRAQGASARQ